MPILSPTDTNRTESIAPYCVQLGRPPIKSREGKDSLQNSVFSFHTKTVSCGRVPQDDRLPVKDASYVRKADVEQLPRAPSFACETNSSRLQNLEV